MKIKYGLMLAIVALMAQTGFAAKNEGVVSKSSATAEVEQEISTITAKDVKNYKTFLEYADKTERLAVKAGKPAEIQPGEIIKVNRSGASFQLSAETPVVYDEQTKSLASLGANKQVAILETNSNVNIIDSKGHVLKQTKIVPYHTGPGYIVFSDSRIFQYGGISEPSGIRIYNYEGKLIKEINSGYVVAKAISFSQKYFVVTITRPMKEKAMVLYDMNGNELLRRELPTARAKIKFSRDDRYILLEVPSRLRSVVNGGIKTTSYYVIDVEKRRIVSDEIY
ncbi:MAG: WD40 repeat domain-containing protein [Elusimicrobia bacterium]|nr:WD40 repeat domain-containing protein [Elusimicrobiota bacterium]